MVKRYALSALVAASLVVTPASTALANDALIGGLVGGIIGGAISQGAQKRTTTRKVYRKKPRVNSAQRQQVREVQTSLNYFGFPAGTPDGVSGRKTRSAISQYQAHLGYPATGQLTQFERDFLISSYYRAQSGGATTAQLIASNPQGVRGLLIVYRDEQLNGGTGTATASIGGHYGLPKVVAAAVNEIAKSSDPSAEQLVQRHGFIQLSDINGDGQTDYILDTSVTGSAFWCNAQSCAVRVFASTPNGYERNDFQAFNVTPAMFSCTRGTCSKTNDGTQLATAQMLPQQPAPQQQPQTQMVAAPAPQANAIATPVATAQPVVSNPAAQAANAAAPALPNFMGGQQSARVSLASHCNKVNLLTSTNGGFVTEDTMTDANLALSEQFCLARTYAIAEGEEMIAKVQGVTPDQIAQQCQSFGPLLKEHVAAVSLQSRDEVLRGVSGFVLGSGMSPAQLAATAKICLSVGYRIDDMDVAMGSALLLTSIGNQPYAELMGHHLSQGIGASKRSDLALVWYGTALDAIAGGAEPVFAPAQPGRTALIEKASVMLSGGSAPAAAAVPAAQSGGGLPVFTISE